MLQMYYRYLLVTISQDCHVSEEYRAGDEEDTPYALHETRKESTLWRVMGWLRLVGSLKWQVSFAEYRLL